MVAVALRDGTTTLTTGSLPSVRGVIRETLDNRLSAKMSPCARW
jgi:hypothetical protein